jgi:hypothetical protein
MELLRLFKLSGADHRQWELCPTNGRAMSRRTASRLGLVCAHLDPHTGPEGTCHLRQLRTSCGRVKCHRSIFVLHTVGCVGPEDSLERYRGFASLAEYGGIAVGWAEQFKDTQTSQRNVTFEINV